MSARPRAQQNLFELSERFRAEVETFRATRPGDVKLEIGWDQSENVERRLGRLQHDFLVALGLVLLTVLPLGFRASLLVLVSMRKASALLENLRATLAAIPGARIVVKEFENGPPIEAPIVVRVFGEVLDLLAQRGVEVERLLRRIEGTHSINNPLRVRRTDLRVVINKPMAAMLGVPEAEIDRAVRLAFAGLDVSRFREDDGDEYPIQVALPRGERATLDNWAKIQVQSPATGAFVPITQLAELKFESTPPVIQRFNRERSVSIAAFVREGFNVDQVTRATAAELKKLEWPANVRWEFGGEVESRQESFGDLGGGAVFADAATDGGSGCGKV